MICSECWANVADRAGKCPRCGAKLTGAPPSLKSLLRANPWLTVLLAASALTTLWLVTRRAPPPPGASAVIEPVIEPPAPPSAAEAEPEPVPAPVPAPSPEAASPAAPPAPVSQDAPPPPGAGHRLDDGTWVPAEGGGSVP